MRKTLAGIVVLGMLLVTALTAANAFALAKPSATAAPAVSADADTPLQNAEWTIIVYLDADNSLQAAGFGDLLEMEAVGSVGGVNVIVLMDTLDAIEETHWYFIGQGETHIDLAAGLNDCDCAKIADGCPGELNMGDPATLTYCLDTAAAYAPAKNYMVDLWDHGGGWWGVCYDESSILLSGSTDRLIMDEVQNGIEESSVDLSIIGYDACFMGMVEIAYENRDLADYMVASITTVPGPGWDYTAWLNGIQATDKSALAISKVIVDTYVDFYSICSGVGLGGFPYTSMGVFDLSKVGDLVLGVKNDLGGIDDIAEALIPLTEDHSLRGIIESSESQTPQIQFHGEAFPFTDIGWYMTLLAEKYPDLADIATRTFDLLDATVVYFDYVTPDADMCLRSYGMSIYYTISGDKLYDNYRTSGLDMVVDTDWDEFLWALNMAN